MLFFVLGQFIRSTIFRELVTNVKGNSQEYKYIGNASCAFVGQSCHTDTCCSFLTCKDDERVYKFHSIIEFCVNFSIIFI